MFLSYVSAWEANDESPMRSFPTGILKKTLSKIVSAERTFFPPSHRPPRAVFPPLPPQLLVEQRGFYSAEERIVYVHGCSN